MKKRASSESPYEKEIGFSRAARNGDFIAVSGTAPLSADGTTAGAGDVYLQTKTCLEIVKRAIEDVGGTIEDTIRTRIFLKDIDRWQEAAKAHGEFFSTICPACSFIGIERFIDKDWLVEVEADCVCQGTTAN